ncbi:MAG: hypothetical protein HKK67_06045 [Chlorobiaceae bacterium]|nr:hypothetical protein [Chlorobiaceae bacterium]
MNHAVGNGKIIVCPNFYAEKTTAVDHFLAEKPSWAMLVNNFGQLGA